MIEDIEKPHRSVARLMEKILDKYEGENKAGLTRSEVIRLTAKMKRENWQPTRTGCEIVREFLQAGFVDCSYDDLERFGLEAYTVSYWARKQPDIVTHELEGNRFNHTVCFNLASNADRWELKTYAERKNKRTKTEKKNTRSCAEQRAAQKAEARRRRERNKHEQPDRADHQGKA